MCKLKNTRQIHNLNEIFTALPLNEIQKGLSRQYQKPIELITNNICRSRSSSNSHAISHYYTNSTNDCAWLRHLTFWSTLTTFWHCRLFIINEYPSCACKNLLCFYLAWSFGSCCNWNKRYHLFSIQFPQEISRTAPSYQECQKNYLALHILI